MTFTQLTYDLHFIFNIFRMSQGSFHANLTLIGAFLKNLTFDPLNDLYPLTYDLHFIFNMFRMSQGSFHVNLSSIGAFLEKLTFDLTFVTLHDLSAGQRWCHMIRLVITYNFCADITHVPNTVLEL